MTISDIIFWISAFDAVAIAVVGAITAGMMILGKEDDDFVYRLIPATAVLVGTSFGAGIIMSIGQWLAS